MEVRLIFELNWAAIFFYSSFLSLHLYTYREGCDDLRTIDSAFFKIHCHDGVVKQMDEKQERFKQFKEGLNYTIHFVSNSKFRFCYLYLCLILFANADEARYAAEWENERM